MFPIFAALSVFSVLATQSAVALPAMQSTPQVVAEKEYSLSDRYGNTHVNNVFADNILLTLAYLRGVAQTGGPVDWTKVKSDFTYTMVLKPGDTFAFHDSVLPQYQGKIAETTNAHFDSTQGFESDGWLVGDGVCHLASFMNVVAKDAKLSVYAPTPHDFAVIPDVAKTDGVAIYYMPGESGSSALQNLYITNNYTVSIGFVFTYKDNKLDIKIEKLG